LITLWTSSLSTIGHLGSFHFFSTVLPSISAILFAVRKPLSIAIILLAGGASVVIAREAREPSSQQPTQTPQQQSAPQQGGAQETGTQQQSSAQIVPPSATHAGPIVILNPAHGGADTGARGPSGAIEKDVVLLFARIVRVELERQGYHVVMTRNDDSNPSYDDRAAIANAHHDALFISIHLGSTGAVGTVRAYFYQFSSTPPTAAGESPAQQSAPSPSGILAWEEAQRPYAEASRHFGDLLETNLAQHFSGSPAASAGVAVRELRSVAAPAVAVEVSSVGVSDPNSLTPFAEPLATAILRSIQAYRPAAATGVK
jgi:N-acetylmuramoyl-L-alanine amidase